MTELSNPTYWEAEPNTVLAGPATGSAEGDAGFRALTLADLPAGLKIARGQHTMLSSSDTVATGLTTVVSAVANLESAPVLTCDRAQAGVGTQAGAPAAGSIYLRVYMPTSAGDTTPVAASGFAAKVVNWIAVGT